MKTIRLIAGIFALLASLNMKSANIAGTGEIKGLVKDENYEPAIGAVIHVTSGGHEVGKAITNEDGKYVVKPLSPGFYDVTIQFIGYKSVTVKKIEVEAEEASYVDVDLQLNLLDGVTIVEEREWKKPVVDPSMYTMHKINSIELGQMAVGKGDIIGAIANISSDIQVSEDGKDIHSRGARVGTTRYYVDGDKLMDVNNSFVGMGIQSLSVITGGIPAQYGDLTGGAVIVTYQDYFTGLAEKNMRQSAFREKQARLAKEKKEKEEKLKRQKEIEEERGK